MYTLHTMTLYTGQPQQISATKGEILSIPLKHLQEGFPRGALISARATLRSTRIMELVGKHCCRS